MSGTESHEERAHLERNHLPLWKVGALGLAYMLIGPSMAMSAGALISARTARRAPPGNASRRCS